MRNDAFDILTLYNPDNEPFPIVYNKEVHKIIQPKKAVRVIKMIGGLALKHLVDRMVQKEGKMVNDMVAREQWTSVILIDIESQSSPVPLTLNDQIKQTTEKLNNETDLERFMNNQAKPATPAVTPQPLPVSQAMAPVVPAVAWKFDPVTGQPLTPTVPVITPETARAEAVEIQQNDPSPIVAGMATAGTGIPADPAVASILSREGGEARVLPEQKMDEDSDLMPAVPTPTAKPTREQLLSFARDTLMMNLDDPKTKAVLDAQTDEQLAATLKYESVA